MPPALKKLAKQLPAVLGLLLLVGAVYVVWKEFRHLKIADIEHALEAIPHRALVIAFVWTLLAYGVLTFYDRLGTIFAGNKVSYGKVAFASFCAYALSHNLGFAAVSGAAVRYRLYAHWGLTPVQIAKVIAFCSLTFGLGGMVLGGLILFIEPDSVPFLGEVIPAWGMYALGALLWAIVLTYVSVSRFVRRFRVFGVDIELPAWRMAFAQVALATLDVAVTAAIVFQLLPPAPHLTYFRFLGVYLSSYSAGLIANIPGGLGVFDSAMLLGLQPYLTAPQILGAVLVFRLYYYVIPLFLAGAMFSGNELLVGSGRMMRRGQGAGRASLVSSGFSERSFAVVASTGSVALCGAMLLAIGVLDERPDFSWLDPDLAGFAMNAGQFVPSLIGATLMVLAIGLSRRVTLAWGMTIALLVIAALFIFAQGGAGWVIAVLLLTALLIAPLREAYYRHARLVARPLRPGTLLPLLVLGVCVLNLAQLEPRVRFFSENDLLQLLLSPDVTNGTRVTLVFVVLMGLFALWRLIRPVRVRSVAWRGDGRFRYASLGGDPPTFADGLIMGEAERAAIPYRRVGDVILGLGDPVGAGSDRVSAIWNLRDFAQQSGCDPAIFGAGRELLKVYEDIGLAVLPLDASGALLDRTDATVRQFLCCVAERDLAALKPLLPELGRAPVPEAAE